MITGVVFVPAAPALVADVGRGLDTELGPVRDACRAAIRRVSAAGAQLVLVGAADVAGVYGPTSRGSFAGYGVDLDVPLGSDEPGPVDLPPSLAVGAWLLRDAVGPDSGAVAIAVTPERRPLPVPDCASTALVVLGEGSARLDPKSPGYFDDRAGEYDRRLRAALVGGEGYRLRNPLIDPRDPIPDSDIEADLLVSGHWVRDRIATPIEANGRADAELLYGGAPFGVGYLVAAWTWTPPTDVELQDQVRSEPTMPQRFSPGRGNVVREAG